MESITIETEENVATLFLSGPGKGNALGPEIWGELPEAVETLDADENVRAIVLRGSGDHFTYGLDLQRNAETFMKIVQGGNLAKERMMLRNMVLEWQQVATCLERCTKPVIAAIHGWCIGGGINIAAAADWRLASADAKFSLREVKLAITADLGALQRLPHIIGEGATRRIAMTGEDFDASYAREIGLVDGVYEDADALFEAARLQAAEVAKNPPLVVESIKNVLNFGRSATVEQGLDYVATWNSAFLESHDMKEAMMAFMEGRSPDFKGD